MFGKFYGQVRERVVREAIKLMHSDGRTSSDGKKPAPPAYGWGRWRR
jgi:hypothetical protein